MRVTVVFFLVSSVICTTPALGEIEYVHNSDIPVNPRQTIHMEELWRIDGESEDCVIGSVARIETGDDGRSYLLDTQSGDVVIVDREGRIADRIGRLGEGPGEYGRPVDLFLTNEGLVGIIQAMPGKVVLLAPNGDPQETSPLTKIWDGGMDLLREGKYAANRLFVRTAFRDRSNPNYSTALDGIASIDQKTDSVTWYRDRSIQRPATVNHHREYDRTYSASPWTWAVDCEGAVYVSEAFDKYEIFVYSANGELFRTIDRKYKTRTRDKKYRKNLQAAFDIGFSGRTYRGVPVTFEVCDVNMDIQEIFARTDGSLWVLSSRGAYDVNEGVIVVFDVFNPSGEFDHQVAVMGEGCYYTDDIFLSGDMFYVIRNVTEDRRGLKNRVENDADRFEIICNQLPTER